MLLQFLQGLGLWALPMAALWLWATSLVLHRVLAVVDACWRLRRLQHSVAGLRTIWQAEDLASAKAETRRLGAGWILNERKLWTTSSRSLTKALPPLASVEAAQEDAELFAALAPLLGLSGTVYGLMRSMHAAAVGGAPDLGNIAVALGTTFAAIIPLVLVILIYGKLPVDVYRFKERELLRDLQKVCLERVGSADAQAKQALPEPPVQACRATSQSECAVLPVEERVRPELVAAESQAPRGRHEF